MSLKNSVVRLSSAFTAVALALVAGTLHSAIYGQEYRPPGPQDRIAWSADGNFADEDDWSATAITLLIFAHEQWQDKLVHFDYNSRIDKNNERKAAENRESTIGGARRFKFNTDRFFDNQTNLEASIENLKNEINKSSDDNRLFIGVAGPFDVLWMALNRADPDKRQYLWMISHGPINEEVKFEGGHGREDCEALGASYKKIESGNGCGERFGGGTCEKWEDVEWLRISPDQDYRWIWSRLEATRVSSRESPKRPDGKLDASDATMAYFMAYNDENGNFITLHEIVGDCLFHCGEI